MATLALLPAESRQTLSSIPLLHAESAWPIPPEPTDDLLGLLKSDDLEREAALLADSANASVGRSSRLRTALSGERHAKQRKVKAFGGGEQTGSSSEHAQRRPANAFTAPSGPLPSAASKVRGNRRASLDTALHYSP